MAKKFIAISEFKLCKNYINQLNKLIDAGVDIFILREKELSEYEYIKLFFKIYPLFKNKKTKLFLHNFLDFARKINYPFFHSSFSNLSLIKNDEFKILGASVHNEKEVFFASEKKCDYAIFGHIFHSSCKENLKPKGLDELRKISDLEILKIYALGGINLNNILELKNLKIEGIAMRSALMQSEDPKQFLEFAKKKLC